MYITLQIQYYTFKNIMDKNGFKTCFSGSTKGRKHQGKLISVHSIFEGRTDEGLS